MKSSDLARQRNFRTYLPGQGRAGEVRRVIYSRHLKALLKGATRRGRNEGKQETEDRTRGQRGNGKAKEEKRKSSLLKGNS